VIKRLFSNYFELVFWVAAMLALAFSTPGAESHFTLCPLKLMGFKCAPAADWAFHYFCSMAISAILFTPTGWAFPL